MGAKSKIKWTDTTWEPIFSRVVVDRQLIEAALDLPLHWRKPRRIAVKPDLFHESVPDEWIDRIFAVMALCPQHTFQVLTKRAERMRSYLSRFATAEAAAEHYGSLVQGKFKDPVFGEELDCCIANSISGANAPDGAGWPLRNVWLVVSAEDQPTADQRIPLLLQTPAAVRGVSLEPLLGPIELPTCQFCKGSGRSVSITSLVYGGRVHHVCPKCNGRKLDWVVVGPESGPHARPAHPDWVRSLRDQCVAAGVSFFFKQWGAWSPAGPARGPHDVYWVHPDGMLSDDAPTADCHASPMVRVGKKRAGRLLDGREWNEYPNDRQS